MAIEFEKGKIKGDSLFFGEVNARFFRETSNSSRHFQKVL